MPLTYTDFQTATGLSVPATADDHMPSQTSVTSMIADIVAATSGEFEEVTGVAFSESTASHKRLLWMLLRRRFIAYRRDKRGSTVSQQTPVGTITTGDSLGSATQLDTEINILVNQINLFSSSMLVGGGYQ
jgi:hypothetical protein